MQGAKAFHRRSGWVFRSELRKVGMGMKLAPKAPTETREEEMAEPPRPPQPALT